jgi:hypothetical protein
LRKCIVVHGNCQADFLCGWLRAFKPVSNEFDIIYSRSYVLQGEEEPPTPQEEDISRAVLLLYQQTDFGKDALIGRFEGHAEVKRFPVMALGVLFPFAFLDPRNKPAPPEHPYGPFPIGDRIGYAVSQEGIRGDKAVAEYYRRSMDSLAMLPRHLEIERDRIRRLDENSDIKISDYVLDQFPIKPIFHHWQHPTGEALGILGDRLFRGADLLRRHVCTIDYRGLVDPMIRGELDPFSGDELPVHPTVAIGLGLRWWKADMTYCVRSPLAAKANFDQFIRAYLDWKWI